MPATQPRWSVRPVTEYRLWVQRLVWGVTWLLTRAMRTEIQGRPPAAPCIIVSNHLHVLDIPIAGRYAVRFAERCHWLAKTELFRAPVLGSILRAMQTVEVHRGRADRKAIEQIVAYAQLDKVWIFPEGTRSRSGRLQPGKEGTVLIARRAAVPLVPVAIAGTEAGLLPLLLRRKTLRVTIGESFTLSPGQGRAAAIAEVMDRIGRLLPPEYRQADLAPGGAEALATACRA